MITKRTVAIVGTGNVGVAAAYALFLGRVATEIILVDMNQRRAEGEALDLLHGQAIVGRTEVRAGTYRDLGEAAVVVLAAGVPQKPGESRLQLLGRNVDVLREVARELDTHAPQALVVVASNPVDILTHAMHRLSKRPAARVIGTGTLLDTARFRALLGHHYGVDPRSVHGYILGEHGDSEVPLWSTVTVGNVPIREHEVLGKRFEEAPMTALFAQVRDAAREIIDRKGYTNLAIGTVIGRIVEDIFDDQHSVVPLSVPLDGEWGLRDVTMSVPTVLGRGGILGRVIPRVHESEVEALRRSAHVLKESMEGLAF